MTQNLLLGSHMSISGGMYRAFERAALTGCTTMQVFTKNNNRWEARPYTPEDIEQYRLAAVRSPVAPVLAHAAYLINLCAAAADVLKKSRAALRDELERCEALGILGLIIHPGSHVGAGEKDGIKRIAESLNVAHADTPKFRTRSILETTAGQGSAIGYRFEQLSGIIDHVDEKDRVGVCFDTCHVFAAGYDISTEGGWDDTIEAFDDVIGLRRLAAIHVNDSRKELGSRVDRHDHIGRGRIGLGGFRMLVNDPRLATVPKILETEKSDDMHEDIENMNVLRSLVLLIILACISFPGFSQSVFTVRDDGEGPSRDYHVIHYRIEVAFDEATKSVSGRTTTTLLPLLPDLTGLDFDAEKLDIRRVTLGTKTLRFEVRPKKLAVTLDRPYGLDDTLTLSVEYTCTPRRGLYFVQPDSSYPDRPWQIWSQGEDMDNHFWFPCYDFPNDMATSEMIATVRSSYVALSNGRLLDVKEDRAKKTKTFHWRQDIPHASYLISLAVGDYAIVNDRAGDIPLEYYVYPRQVADAKVCFASTPDMVIWFGERIGYKYPWAKYAQVLIKDFVVGGMENISATSLADEAAVYDARARVDESPTSLIAHELAHQWWGDVLTCKDWRHLWLNESFASYFDPLWHEHALGRDEFDYTMFNDQRAGINSDKHTGRKPIVSVGSYGENVYPRGASVLHMLRFVLGDKLFWKALHHYILKYQHTAVETNDLKVAIEEATGQNLFWFFDEWLYKAGYPVFDLSYDWSDTVKTLFLHVRQIQKTDSLTVVFRTPVDIELTMPEGRATRRFNILTRDTTFTLPAASRPRLVIFDKGNWILKEMKWTKSNDEWTYQAEHASDPVDRLLAIQELSGMRNNASFISSLARIARDDTFWAVRREAVLAFETIDSTDSVQKSEITRTLLSAAADRKPDVRVAAISQLRRYPGGTVIATLRAALKDSSYRVVAAALRSMAKADSANARQLLLSYIDVPSHRNTISASALRSLATVDTLRAVDLSLVKGRNGEPRELRFTALGILSRYGKGRKDVLHLLESIAGERQSFVRMFAIGVLGDLGDTEVIPALEKIAADGEDQSSSRAKASIQKIRKRLGGTN